MANIAGQKMKVTLQLQSGEFFELDAYAVSLTQKADMVDASDYSNTYYLSARTKVEMSFIGVGNLTTGIKKAMVVCVACGSEWHDDEYHPGTCGNCGWGAKNTKRNV